MTDGPGTRTVQLDPHGTGSMTAYDVDFTSVDVDEAHAAFTFEISGSNADLSPASISPVVGWVTWAGGEIALAYRFEELDEIGSSKVLAEVEDDDGDVDFDALAGAIATAILAA